MSQQREWAVLAFCLTSVLLFSGELLAWQDQPQSPPVPVLSRELIENGPPAQRPADDPGPPPGPGLFYVPGEFVPSGKEVLWQSGYWSEEQPGWVWSPARWVLGSQGWSFREGHWERNRTRTLGMPAQAAPDPDPDPDQAAGGVMVHPGDRQISIQVTGTLVPRFTPITLFPSYPAITSGWNSWVGPYGGVFTTLPGTGFGPVSVGTPVFPGPFMSPLALGGGPWIGNGFWGNSWGSPWGNPWGLGFGVRSFGFPRGGLWGPRFWGW